MDNRSQNSRIKADLEAGKRITPMDALRDYGCFRLGARIYNLKQLGVKIISEMITLDSGKRVAEYRQEK